MLDVPRPQVLQGEAVTPSPALGSSTPAWLTAHRRPARGYERHTPDSGAMIHWAAEMEGEDRACRDARRGYQRMWWRAERMPGISLYAADREVGVRGG